MKKTLLLLSGLALSLGLSAQVVIFDDDFEAYNVGPFEAQADPNEWEGWDGAVTTSAISTEQAHSGVNSLKATTNTDVVAKFPTQVGGLVEVKFEMYVPSTNGNGIAGGYFNLLHDYAGANSAWLLEAFFSSPLTPNNCYLSIGNGALVLPFTGIYDQWVECKFMLDLAYDHATFWYNGVTAAQWQISLSGGPLQIEAVNFYGYCNNMPNCNPKYYFDDIMVTQLPTPTYDCAIASAPIANEYTQIPVGHETALALEPTVQNIGMSSVTNVSVETSVWQDGNQVFNASGNVMNMLTPGSMVPLPPNGSYTPSGLGSYQVRYVSTITEVDAMPFNDTLLVQAPTVTDSTFARDNNVITGSLGSTTGSVLMGQEYTMQQDAELTSVTFAYAGGAVGNTIGVHVLEVVNGEPSVLITNKFNIPLTAAGAGIGNPIWRTIMLDTSVMLNAGSTYAILVEQETANINLGLCTTGSIYLPGKTWLYLGGAWNHIEDVNVGLRMFVVRPNIHPIPVGVQQVAVNPFDVRISPNPNDGIFTIELQNAPIGEGTFELADLTGRVLSTERLNTTGFMHYAYNGTHLPSGVYMAKFTFGNQVVTKKVVLSK